MYWVIWLLPEGGVVPLKYKLIGIGTTFLFFYRSSELYIELPLRSPEGTYLIENWLIE